jgi:hypothetical protein
LYRYGPSKEGVLCRGFIGSQGLQMKFCTKPLVQGRQDCGVASHGRPKFVLEPSSYYIKMQGESALCFPFVSQAALVSTNSLGLVKGQYTPIQWAAILYKFLREHGLLGQGSVVPSNSSSVSEVEEMVDSNMQQLRGASSIGGMEIPGDSLLL